MADSIIQYKTCSKCGKTKAIAAFARSTGKRRNKDGFRGDCKQCVNAERRGRPRRTHFIAADSQHCPDCDTTKPASDFHKCNQRENGLSFYCRKCSGARAAKHGKTAKAIATRKARYKRMMADPKTRKEMRKAARASHYRNREKRIASIRFRLYGLTHQQYCCLRDRQDNRCAICQESLVEARGRMTIDHCHETGKVRGLLCAQCNTGLGMFRENTEIVSNALRYILKHAAKSAA